MKKLLVGALLLLIFSAPCMAGNRFGVFSYSKGNLNSILGTFETTSAMNTALGTFETTAAMNIALGTFETVADFTSAIGTFETVSALNSTLGTFETVSALNATLGTFETTTAHDLSLSSALGTFETIAAFTSAIGTFETTTAHDLSLASALGTFETVSALNATLGTFETVADFTSAIGTFETTAAMNSALGTFETKAELLALVHTTSIESTAGGSIDGTLSMGIARAGSIEGTGGGKIDGTLTIQNLTVTGTATMDTAFVGATATPVSDFNLTKLVVSQADAGDTSIDYPTGIFGEAVSSGIHAAAGVWGTAKTSATLAANGVFGKALVSETGTTVDAIGVSGNADATHAGGRNIAIKGAAQNGATNYSFYGVAGNVGLASGINITTLAELEMLKFTQTPSAVNEITITNAATLGSPEVSATGDDTHIGLKLTAKGNKAIEAQSPFLPKVLATTPDAYALDQAPEGSIVFVTSAHKLYFRGVTTWEAINSTP